MGEGDAIEGGGARGVDRAWFTPFEAVYDANIAAGSIEKGGGRAVGEADEADRRAQQSNAASSAREYRIGVDLAGGYHAHLGG